MAHHVHVGLGMNPDHPIPVRRRRRGYTILLVTNDMLCGAKIAGFLGRVGHRVWISEGDEATLTGMSRLRFDVVLIDRTLRARNAIAAVIESEADPGRSAILEVSALDAMPPSRSAEEGIQALDGGQGPAGLIDRIEQEVVRRRRAHTLPQRAPRIIRRVDGMVWTRDRNGKIRRVQVL